ncbi:efflux RND transporter periplasmic adaptor subunit [Alteromonadaceae bacterium M269]|nr:efflux RND transporter periplasmic adaptor subunit [Alteromonadaceae bacterium M269]
MKKISLALVMLSTSIVVAQETPPEPPPVLVEVESVQSERISEQVWVSGTVVSRTDSNIASEVAGRVTWMADVGDLVEEGEVLAKLDDQRLLLEKEQNLANIARWQSSVTLLTRKQERFSQMAKSNAASRDELDQVLSDLEVAKQELAQAEINKKLTDYRLSQTQVRAPFKALVVERLQSPGEYTAVGADMLRIVDTSSVEASVRAPLSAVPYIASGMPVKVKHNTVEKEQLIRTIVPVGNAVSRMMEVRVSLASGDFAIGSAVRVALPHSEFYQAMTVPRDALVLRKAGTFVYLVDDANVAHQIPVQTGIGVGSRIEVNGELDDNMPVVIRGAERLREGQKVRYEQNAEIARR